MSRRDGGVLSEAAKGDLISLLLSVGISFVVIAINWISFRPMVGIPLLVLGVGCFVPIIRKVMKAKKEMSPVTGWTNYQRSRISTS